MQKKYRVSLRLYLLLLAACISSTAFFVPSAMMLRPQIFNGSVLPIEAQFAILVGQASVFFAVIIYLGMFLGRRVRLGAPILERLLKGKKVSEWVKKTAWLSAMFGAAVAFGLFGLDFAFAESSGLQSYSGVLPLWQGVGAALYGAVCEEVMVRLFLMTLIAYVAMKVKSKKKRPTDVGVWVAIVLSAGIFGGLQLLGLQGSLDLNGAVVTREIAMSVSAGAVFGWLYWKKGFEAAMLAHLIASLILFVVPALVN